MRSTAIGADDTHPRHHHPADFGGGGARRPRHRLPFAAEVAGIVEHREVCLAAELEVRLDVGVVPPERIDIFLAQLRDEIRRLVQVPMAQVIVLRDRDCADGVVQVGFLHPDLVEVDYSPDAGGVLPLEEIGTMWDRLVLALRGGAGLHRIHATSAFPLVQRARPSELRWLAAIVALRDQWPWLMDSLDRIKEAQGAAQEFDGFDDSWIARLLSRGPGADEAAAEAERATTAASKLRRRRSDLSEPAVRAPSSAELVVFQRTLSKCNDAEATRAEASLLRPVRAEVKGSFPRVPPQLDDWRLPNVVQRPGGRALASDIASATGDMFLRPAATDMDASNLPLHGLIWRGDERGALQALRRATPAQANARDRRGRTPLHVAVAAGTVAIVRCFVRLSKPAGAVKLDARDARGRTALLYAVYRGDAAIVTLLAGRLSVEEINAADPQGETAIVVAARTGRVDVLRALLEQGAVEKPDEFGKTPLMWAEGLGHEEVVRVLKAMAQSRLVGERARPRGHGGHGGHGDHGDHGELVLSFASEVDAAIPKPARPATRDAHTAPPADGPAARPPSSPPWRSVTVPSSARIPRGNVSGRAIISCGRHDGWGSARPGSQPLRPAVGDGRPGSPTSKRASVAEDHEPPSTPRLPTPDRSALLSGQMPRQPRPRRPRTCGGAGDFEEWPGNVGSLAVRWRCWAQATLLDADSAAGRSIAPAPVHKFAFPGEFAAVVSSAETTQGQIGKACDKVGGDFCTTCWEHVLCGHGKE